MYRILIAEDDEGIAKPLARQIREWGFAVRCVADFRNVLREFAQYDPQLVLMDIGLPFYNGYHWCGEIRKISSVPIVFLSSAADNMNIVMAMNMGADDFIAKPFDYHVLIAKLQAILRRVYDYTAPQKLLEHRGAVLNTDDATLSYKGQTMDLTKNEYRIIQALLEKKGKVVSREFLMQRLWESDAFVDENTLTVNVTRLRKKLDAAGLADFIKTKVGMGYLVE